MPSQLEKKYQEWILHMHDHYDEEFGGEEFCGADDPVVVVGPTNKKKLRITSDGKILLLVPRLSAGDCNVVCLIKSHLV